MEKNEVAVVKFDVAAIEPDFIETIREEMDGLGSLPMENIKIPAGGGIAFELPTDDPDNPDMVKEVTGIIVAHHPQNSWWAQSYSGANENPDCFSPDGKQGVNTSTGEVRACDGCLMNQFGSAVDAQGRPAKGKACKNLHRLFILQEGALLPVIINIPPTSIKAWKDYLGKRLLLKGKKPSQVITKVSLKKAVSGDGITYSQCVFTKVADLTADIMEQVKPTAELTKQLLASQQQSIAESVPEQAVEVIEAPEQTVPAPFESMPQTRAEAGEAAGVFEEVDDLKAPF